MPLRGCKVDRDRRAQRVHRALQRDVGAAPFLAVMRTLGASRRQLFTQPLLEGLLLAGAGALLGIVLGHGVAEAVGRVLPEGRNMGMTGFIWLTEEFYVLILAMLVGLLAPCCLRSRPIARTSPRCWHRARKSIH